MKNTPFSFKAYAYLAIYLFKVVRRNPSTLIRIIFGKTLIDGPEVRKILVLGEYQPDLKDKSIDLRIELNPKE